MTDKYAPVMGMPIRKDKKVNININMLWFFVNFTIILMSQDVYELLLQHAAL